MIPAELSARLFRLFPVIPAVIPATPVVIPIIPMVIPVIPMVIPIISRYPSGHSLNPGHSHPIPLHPKVRFPFPWGTFPRGSLVDPRTPRSGFQDSGILVGMLGHP